MKIIYSNMNTHLYTIYRFGGIYFSLTHIHFLFYETEELLKTAYDSFLSSEFVYSDNVLKTKHLFC